MPEKMTVLERARDMLDKVKDGSYEPSLAVYMFRDLPEVKAVDMDSYAWMLAVSRYWTPKSEAVDFFEMLIERLEKEK